MLWNMFRPSGIELGIMLLLPDLSLCLYRGRVAVSFEEANRVCTDLGPDFKLTDTSGEHDRRKIHRAIKRGEISSAWLPFTRIKFPDFTYIDGTFADPTVNGIGQDLGNGCGAIDLLSEHYDFRPCHQTGLSFLCETKACEACYTIGKTFHECIVVEGSCFSFHCGSTNWYNARDMCMKEGGDLAIIKERTLIPTFKEFWKPTYKSPCSTAWIGLHQESWIDGKTAEPKFSFWEEDEPSKNGNCSVIHENRGEIAWRAEPCDERHPVFCSQKESQLLSTVENKGFSQTGRTSPFQQKSSTVQEVQHQSLNFLTICIAAGIALNTLMMIFISVKIYTLHLLNKDIEKVGAALFGNRMGEKRFSTFSVKRMDENTCELRKEKVPSPESGPSMEEQVCLLEANKRDLSATQQGSS